MKSFVYTIRVKSRSRGGIEYKTVRLWRVKRNVLTLIGDRDFTFEDDFQAAFAFAEERKLLPRRAFARYSHSNSHVYGNAWSLREAGIATFYKV